MFKKFTAFVLVLLIAVSAHSFVFAAEEHASTPEIVYTYASGVDVDDPDIAELIDVWKSRFNDMPVIWKQYVKRVDFANGTESTNTAGARSDPEKANYRTVIIYLTKENENGEMVPNIQNNYTVWAYHEAAHMFDTNKNLYSGPDSKYTVDGKNFHQLWSEDTTEGKSSFSERFGQLIGSARFYQVRDGNIDNAMSIQPIYKPYLLQLLPELNTTFPDIYDLTLTGWPAGNDVGGETYKFDVRKTGYEASPTTFAVNNTGNIPTGELTVTLSDTEIFTLGDAGTSVTEKKIDSIGVGEDTNFNIMKNSGAAPGVYTAEVKVTNAETGYSRFFNIEMTVEE